MASEDIVLTTDGGEAVLDLVASGTDELTTQVDSNTVIISSDVLEPSELREAMGTDPTGNEPIKIILPDGTVMSEAALNQLIQDQAAKSPVVSVVKTSSPVLQQFTSAKIQIPKLHNNRIPMKLKPGQQLGKSILSCAPSKIIPVSPTKRAIAPVSPARPVQPKRPQQIIHLTGGNQLLVNQATVKGLPGNIKIVNSSQQVHLPIQSVAAPMKIINSADNQQQSRLVLAKQAGTTVSVPVSSFGKDFLSSGNQTHISTNNRLEINDRLKLITSANQQPGGKNVSIIKLTPEQVHSSGKMTLIPMTTASPLKSSGYKLVAIAPSSVQVPNNTYESSNDKLKPVKQTIAVDQSDAYDNTISEKKHIRASTGRPLNGMDGPMPVPIRPRKPCNCTKSQCLKLYCECFSNGEFCHNCNCHNCFNNLDHEEARLKSVRLTLERNPTAFNPKIGKADGSRHRSHTRGCNCKRSGCLKNYCECFEARIFCTNNCRCNGCKNYENALDHGLLTSLAEAAELRTKQQSAAKDRLAQQLALNDTSNPNIAFGKRNITVTQDIIEATTACLLAQAEEAELRGQSLEEVEALVLEEYERCIMKIISSAGKMRTIQQSASNDV